MFQCIILLRHGESADKQAGQTDFDRVLTGRGRHSILQLGQHLIAEKIFPDIILSSSAVRTQETTQTLTGIPEAPKSRIIFEPALYLGLDDDYIEVIHKVERPSGILMIVGHNPTISALVGWITNHYSKALLPGQAAHILLDTSFERPNEISGKLVQLIGPFLK
jgi:phosphohistidine phosphatase